MSSILCNLNHVYTFHEKRTGLFFIHRLLPLINFLFNTSISFTVSLDEALVFVHFNSHWPSLQHTPGTDPTYWRLAIP